MFFTKEQMRKLIIPLLIEQLLNVTVGMVDVIMIAGTGEAAVSGVSLVDNISVLLIEFFSALGTGGAVVAGQYLGQKNQKKANQAANQELLFIMIASLVVMLLFLVAHQQILRGLFGKIDENVMKAARTYLLITAFSIPPLALYNGCAALFRVMGNSKITMWISLWMNIINCAGNFILIYGAGIGVAGTAIATTVSRYAAALIGVILLTRKGQIIRIDRGFEFHFHRDMIQRILFLGIPNGLENSIFQLGKIMILSLVSVCGTSAIAANAVAGNLTTLNILPGTALGLAMLSVVSVCVGAQDYEQVRHYTRTLMRQTRFYISIMSLFMILSAKWILTAYHLSPETALLAKELIWYHAVCAVICWPESFTLPNALRASNDVKFTMITSILSMWIFRIFFSYLLVKVFSFGVMGVWIAMTIDWLFRAVVFELRYLKGRWMTKYRGG